jgi:hypothetical protein
MVVGVRSSLGEAWPLPKPKPSPLPAPLSIPVHRKGDA